MEAARQAAEQGDAARVDRKRKKDQQAAAEQAAFIEPDEELDGGEYQPGMESEDEQRGDPEAEAEAGYEAVDGESAAARLAGTGGASAGTPNFLHFIALAALNFRRPTCDAGPDPFVCSLAWQHGSLARSYQLLHCRLIVVWPQQQYFGFQTLEQLPGSVLTGQQLSLMSYLHIPRTLMPASAFSIHEFHLMTS